MLLKFKNESEWLAAKKVDITSTEIAALFGLSPYKSRLRLWHEKRGEVESDFEETPFTVWGRRLQNAIGAGIAEDQGWEAEDLSLLYLRDPATRLGASMDFRVNCPTKGSGLLEVKRTTAFSEDIGWFKDRAPVSYEFQIQGQLHLALKEGQGIGWGAIGALGGHSDTRLYERVYDAALGALIDEETTKFWRSVEQHEPPAPDYAVDADLIRKLQGNIDLGRTISLTGNNAAHNLFDQYITLSGVLKEHTPHINDTTARMLKIKNELHHMMGNAEQALIGDFVIKARETEVEDKFVHGYKFRRFDVSKRKGVKK